MVKRKKRLRSGFTTGACAAAAAKAASMALLGLPLGAFVQIPFPNGERRYFKLKDASLIDSKTARASIIKDAGDDPDVTNGAEIAAQAEIVKNRGKVIIKGGHGVGVVTRPGLAVNIGEPAINPVPRKMITEAVLEASRESKRKVSIQITISVPEGEKLARKTLNARLGIFGGISILGTTGIVHPMSDEAWTATIKSSMDVARAMGLEEIVLSSGRASERAHMRKYSLSESSYILSGDFVEFSLLEAKEHGFGRIHLCAQWAKMLKIALSTPDTHVRAGTINLKRAIIMLQNLGLKIPERDFNTAREIFEIIENKKFLKKVCHRAAEYGHKTSGIQTIAHLVSYDGDIIAESE